jgi:hypothetical protein
MNDELIRIGLTAQSIGSPANLGSKPDERDAFWHINKLRNRWLGPLNSNVLREPKSEDVKHARRDREKL